MRKNKLYIIPVIALLSVFTVKLFSQDVDVISPYIQLQYFKNTDDQRTLKTSLTYSKNRMELPIPGMEISFYTGTDDLELLGTGITDEKGIALLDLTDDMKLMTDTDGMWAFSSEYKGNDTIEAGTSELTIKDVKLDLVLSEVDSVKTITVTARVMEGNSEKPVPDEVVMIYVPRMFSLLPISELYLDESGTATVEFPSDLPGDKEGNITILARFDDNYTFGNVERKQTLMWGVPTDYFIPESHRALWTKTPPKWMIYTLSILLAGVWGHYLYALISLIRIKKDADHHKAKEEFRI